MKAGAGQGAISYHFLSLDVSLAMVETPFIQGCTGFPCANFSAGGEVTPGGEIFKRILFNPPVIGEWLSEWGHGELALELRGTRYVAAQFQDRKVLRSWPQAMVQWADPGLDVRLRADVWAPVRAKDVADTSLPVMIARLRVDGPAGQTVGLDYDVTRVNPFDPTFNSAGETTGRLDYFEDFGLGWDHLERGDIALFERRDDHTVRGRLALTLPASGNRMVYLYLLFWHPQCRAAADFADLPGLLPGGPAAGFAAGLVWHRRCGAFAGVHVLRQSR